MSERVALTSKELGMVHPVVIPGRQGIVDFVSSFRHHRLVLTLRLHLRRGQLRLPRRDAPQLAWYRHHREPESPGSSAPAGRLPFLLPVYSAPSTRQLTMKNKIIPIVISDVSAEPTGYYYYFFLVNVSLLRGASPPLLLTQLLHTASDGNDVDTLVS